MCFCCWESEFSRYNFFLDHERPAQFGAPQCGRFQRVLTVYRVVLALFWFASWCFDLVGDNIYYPIYLTNWAFMLITLCAILKACCAINHEVKISRSPGGVYRYKSMPTLYKITWVLYNLANSTALVVTILYWAVIYYGSGDPLNYINMVTHAFNSVYVVFTIWITPFPIRILHVWFPMVECALYGVFSAVYYCAGGVNMDGEPYIYAPLDWGTKPGQTAGAILALVFILVPGTHFICFLIYKLRLLVCEKCGCVGAFDETAYEDIIDDPENKEEKGEKESLRLSE